MGYPMSRPTQKGDHGLFDFLSGPTTMHRRTDCWWVGLVGRGSLLCFILYANTYLHIVLSAFSLVIVCGMYQWSQIRTSHVPLFIDLHLLYIQLEYWLSLWYLLLYLYFNITHVYHYSTHIAVFCWHSSFLPSIPYNTLTMSSSPRLSPPPAGKRRRVDTRQFLDISACQVDDRESDLEDEDDLIGMSVIAILSK